MYAFKKKFFSLKWKGFASDGKDFLADMKMITEAYGQVNNTYTFNLLYAELE